MFCLLTKPLAFRSTGTVLLQFVMKYEACKSMVNGHSNRLVTKYDQLPFAKPGLAKATVLTEQGHTAALSIHVQQ